MSSFLEALVMNHGDQDTKDIYNETKDEGKDNQVVPRKIQK